MTSSPACLRAFWIAWTISRAGPRGPARRRARAPARPPARPPPRPGSPRAAASPGSGRRGSSSCSRPVDVDPDQALAADRLRRRGRGRAPRPRRRPAASACRTGGRACGSWASPGSVTSSASSETNSSSLTLSSAATISPRRSISARSDSVATITALRSGWRILTFACGARRPPELDRAQRRLDPGLELGVLERRVGLGEVAQVHRVGSPTPRVAAGEVGVDLVGEEGDERREQRGDLEQAVAQGRERGPVAVPEAPAREPHVPVRELLDVGRDRPTGGRAVEASMRSITSAVVPCSRLSAHRSKIRRTATSGERRAHESELRRLESPPRSRTGPRTSTCSRA